MSLDQVEILSATLDRLIELMQGEMGTEGFIVETRRRLADLEELHETQVKKFRNAWGVLWTMISGMGLLIGQRIVEMWGK